MDRWTDEEFRRVAQNTRIKDRTLDACQDVLVGGMSGVDAADKHKMFPAQISRAIATLRGKQAELIADPALGTKSSAVSQMVAAETAKALLGQGFESRLAQPGQAYSGPLVIQAAGYLVQNVGRSGVLHDVANFRQIPPLKEDVTIAYGREGGMARVSAIQPLDKGPGVAR